MILTMFRHDHGMIMVRSWNAGHVFPTRVSLENLNLQQNYPIKKLPILGKYVVPILCDCHSNRNVLNFCGTIEQSFKLF